MVYIVKREWHQVERRYGLDIDEDIVSQIYPDFTDTEIQEVLEELKSGVIAVETLLEDAESNGVFLDFDWLDEDDWVTDRKGGYEVTYEITDEDAPPEPAELYCHDCFWEGERENAVVEDNLLMCPECNKPVGHVDDSVQEEASLDDLRSQLYDMMKVKDA